MEFERFEAKFKACVSDAAIRTKFEHHYRQGVDVVGKLKELVASEEEKIRENRCVRGGRVGGGREGEVGERGREG